MRRLLLALAVLHAPAAAAKGRLLELCKPGDTRALAAAGERLRRLDAAFEALAPDADPTALRAELGAAMSSPCLDFSAEHQIPPPLADARAAQRWWRDGGGEWLRSYLGLPSHHIPGNRIVRAVIVPPDERPLLGTGPARETLAPLLCPAADADCARATAGWTMRADDAFARLALVAEEQDRRFQAFVYGRLQGRHDQCAGKRRYLEWRDCIADTARTQAVVPVGAIRAPSRGWLLLSDRRVRCESLRAYDLATGAAFVTEVCPARAPRARAGRLPLDALRETAWMLLIGPEIVELAATSEEVPLPAGLVPRFRSDDERHVSGTGTASGSPENAARWSLVDGGRVLASGELGWPSADAPAQHAAELLLIAEAAFVPGPPPEPVHEL